MRGATLCLATLLGLAAGCSSSGDTVEDPLGHYALSLIGPAERIDDEGRVAWRMRESGVTVAVQRVAKTDHVAQDRTLDDVARALDSRYSYGEVSGAVSREHCTVAGGDAYCLDAWTRGRPGAERAKALRRGVLVDAGDELLLVEAVGPVGSERAVIEQYAAIRASLRILPRS